jgi:septum formation protein
MKIILASGSPRRRDLLQQMGVQFDVIPSSYEEQLDDSRSPEDVAMELALGKALDVATTRPDALVIGADTIVTLDGKQLGKPESAEHAKEMLRSLAGRAHEVTTGLAIVCKAKGIRQTHADTTKVFFADYKEQAIDAYIATGDPFDKAGAYGIQTIYGTLITKIEGDFDTVMGLNTTSLARMLREQDIDAVPVAISADTIHKMV